MYLPTALEALKEWPRTSKISALRGALIKSSDNIHSGCPLCLSCGCKSESATGTMDTRREAPSYVAVDVCPFLSLSFSSSCSTSASVAILSRSRAAAAAADDAGAAAAVDDDDDVFPLSSLLAVRVCVDVVKLGALLRQHFLNFFLLPQGHASFGFVLIFVCFVVCLVLTSLIVLKLAMLMCNACL